MEEVSNPGEMLDQNQAVMETTSPQTEAHQEATESQSSGQDKSPSDQQDTAWIRRLRRERDDAIRKSNESEKNAQMEREVYRQLMANQSAHSTAPVEEDILQQIGKEEYVPGDKVVKALQRQRDDFRKEIDELKKASEKTKMNSMLDDLKREYTDFDDVVNPETLALLDENYPRIAQSIAKNKDPYDMALLAYETIKSKGLSEKVPGYRREKEVEKRLEQNKKTVQTPQAYDKRPMAQAFRMPEGKKEKEALWQETLKYASMGGGGY